MYPIEIKYLMNIVDFHERAKKIILQDNFPKLSTFERNFYIEMGLIV
jgi:hypothetical protein